MFFRAWNVSKIQLHLFCVKQSDTFIICSNDPKRFNNQTIRNAFTDFITKLANVTYETIHELPIERDFGIDGNDYLDLIWNLTWKFQPDVSSGTGVKVILQDTITEVGLCYSFNSKLSVYNSYRWFSFINCCIKILITIYSICIAVTGRRIVGTLFAKMTQ